MDVQQFGASLRAGPPSGRSFISISGLILLGTSSLPVLAQPSNCVNYWVNPRTGKTECLDPGSSNPSTPAPSPTLAPTAPAPALPKTPTPKPQGSQVTAVKGLDLLKACQPITIASPNPLLAKVKLRTVIKGWKNNRCSVEYFAQLTEPQTQEWLTSRCLYRRQTIAMMTDKKAYEQARQFDKTGKLSISFSLDNPRDRAASEALEKDCQFYEPPPSLRRGQ